MQNIAEYKIQVKLAYHYSAAISANSEQHSLRLMPLHGAWGVIFKGTSPSHRRLAYCQECI